MGTSSSGRRLALLGLVVMALALVSCGSDDEPTSSGSSDRPVLTIGVIAPLDGGLTGFGHDIRNGVQLAVDAANKANAVPGYRIELRAMDDSSDAAKGRAAATKLADDETVIGVVGTYNSGVAREVAPVFDAAGITMISPGNTDLALTRGDDHAAPQRQWDHYFRMVAADDVQGPFLADQAKGDLGFTDAAVISETKPVSKGLADVFAAEFARAGGKVLHREVVPDGTTDFATVLRTVGPMAPDVVFFGGEYQVAAALRKQATAAGIKVPVMGGDGIKDAAYIEAAGSDSEGDLASSIGRPVADSPSAASFLEAYKKAGFDEPPGDFGPYAFDAANVLLAAAAEVLDDGADITPEQRDAIRLAVGRVKTDGASGTVAFDEFGDPRTKVLTLYRVEAGEWKAVRSEDMASS